jgi:ABC-type multidrug transport system permease subunit
LSSLEDEFRRAHAFLVLSAKNWSSYRLDMVFFLFNAMLAAGAYGLLGGYVESATSIVGFPGVDYRAYLLVGIAFSTLLLESINMPLKAIDPWQLEQLLLTPTRRSTLLVGISLWPYVLNSVVVLLYFAVGVLISVQFVINVPLFLLTVVLSFLMMYGLGMVAAGVQIVNKKWNPVTWFFGGLTMIFGGVLFPPSITGSLGIISYLLPQYYLLDLFRRALLLGTGVSGAWLTLVGLGVASCLVFVIGYAVFCWGLDKTREKGSVGQF